jgi:hypothetical protein
MFLRLLIIFEVLKQIIPWKIDKILTIRIKKKEGEESRGGKGVRRRGD